MAMQPPYSPNVVNQTVSYDGQTWKGNPGSGWTIEQKAAPTQQEATTSAIQSAGQIRDFNIQSNQPAIQSLQTQSTDLTSRYKDLLDSIKGQQGVAQDAQTLATNNEMARRGISSDSGLAQQQQASALRPIASQYQSLTANAGLQEQGATNAIAQAIAQLQSGSPMESVNSALNLGGQINSANQFSQQLAQQKAISDAQIALQREQGQQQQSPNQYQVLSPGQTLYDLTKNSPLYTAQKLQSQLGGGGSSNPLGI